MTGSAARWYWYPIVGTVALLAWAPAFGNGFCWDDRALIMENPQLADPDALGEVLTQDFWGAEERAANSEYYRPLVTLSYIAEYRLFELDARAYHATNLLIHVFAVVLLLALLVRLGVPLRAALPGALLFGVHPALGECAAWVSGRTDSLAALFVLVYLLSDLRREKPGWWVASIAALACALGSKEIAVAAPVIAVILDAARKTPWKRAIAARWDAAVLIALFLAVRRLVLGTVVSATPLDESFLPLPDRFAAVPYLLGLIPAPLHGRVQYGATLPLSAFLPGAALGLVAIGLMLFGVFRLRRTSADGARIARGLIASGLAAYLPSTVAVIFHSVVGARMLYLPALFLIPGGVLLVQGLIPQKARLAVWSVAVAVLGLLAARESLKWRSDLVLWETAEKEAHPSSAVLTNLGLAYHDGGRLGEALDRLERAIAMEPNDGAARRMSYYLRGLTFMEIGCVDRAVESYRLALRIDPKYASAANNLGALLAELGRADEGYAVLEQAVRHGAKDKEISTNMELLARSRGAAQAPRTAPPTPFDCASDSALRAFLGDAVALNRQGLSKLQQKHLPQAHVLLQAALHQNPDLVAAKLNLAQWSILSGKPDEARGILREILARDPGNRPALRLTSYLDHSPPR